MKGEREEDKEGGEGREAGSMEGGREERWQERALCDRKSAGSRISIYVGGMDYLQLLSSSGFTGCT